MNNMVSTPNKGHGSKGTSAQYLSLLTAFLLIASPSFGADGRLITISTRPSVSVSFYYMQNPAAKATVVLLAGGKGDIVLKNGVPTSKNFLVRIRDYFAADGLNVAVLDRPSDHDELGYMFRVSDEHVEDIRKTVAYLKKDPGLPVWLVGTSRGTVSATAAAIAFGNAELAGIVLTSSVTERKKTGDERPGKKTYSCERRRKPFWRPLRTFALAWIYRDGARSSGHHRRLDRQPCSLITFIRDTGVPPKGRNLIFRCRDRLSAP